jgi:hypothetical protein
MVKPTSFLIITLDSCRYDTFQSTPTPHLSQLGTLHRAMAPGHFTLPSHSALFAGYTPGVAESNEPIVNPRRGRLFRIAGVDRRKEDRDFVVLEGHNFINGLGRIGYRTFGTGAVRWFDPSTSAGEMMVKDFDSFFYSGDCFSLRRQLKWIDNKLDDVGDSPVLVFLNVGETHVPYWHEGAPWDREHNPCQLFGKENDADVCRERQSACLAWVDAELGPLLTRFAHATTLVCADHGDAWGEDDLWEHGFHHPTVLEVPLLFRLGEAPETPSLTQESVRRRSVEVGRRLRSGIRKR